MEKTELTRAADILKQAEKSNNGPYPQVASFDYLCETVEAMAKAGLNPEGFWKVAEHVGYVQKLAGVWHWQDPRQGWRGLKP